MKNRFVTTAVTAVMALAVTGLVAPAGTAAPAATSGNKSLAKVLAADGKRFDNNRQDFDILDAAVTAVLAAKPNSPVKILAQGTQPLTAFLPTDAAFRYLVRSLTGKAYPKERTTFIALAKAAGIDTIETVLLYHVVPGATIPRSSALKANGVKLTTAQGGTITVKVTGKGNHKIVTLRDADPNAKNPQIVAFNINKGNKQIGHGINRVLRPVDL